MIFAGANKSAIKKAIGKTIGHVKNSECTRKTKSSRE